MAEYYHVFRRALAQLGGHGGIRGFLLQLVRCVLRQVMTMYIGCEVIFYICVEISVNKL